MNKPIVQFKFIGGAGFIRKGHQARIMVFNHPKSSKGGGWEEATTTEVLEINREEGTFETRNTVYKLWNQQSFPIVAGELAPHQYEWHNPLKGDLPQYNETVLLVVKGEPRIGKLRRETGSFEDSYASYDYWMDIAEREDWEWEDVTAWAELPLLPQWS